MTAPPRDPYEWVDTTSLDPDFWLTKRTFEPQVSPQKYVQRAVRSIRVPSDYRPIPGPDPKFLAALARYTREALFPNLRRQRVLDQAVRWVVASECSSIGMTWMAPKYLRMLYGDMVEIVRVAPRIRTKFKSLWSEQS